MERFYRRQYDGKSRWASYWHQIDETLRLEPRTVLEIGPGNGTVTTYLRDRGLTVTTIDLAADTEPDVIGDVRHLPFPDQMFDVALCCQVLEHIPFDDIPIALHELRRIARIGVVISVPQKGAGVSIDIRLPLLPRMTFQRKLQSRKTFTANAKHYWELGARNYRLARVLPLLEREFTVARTFTVPENFYHRFFVLKSR